MSAAEAVNSPPERRRAPRARCFRQARCVFNNGQSAIDVTLRNLSETGAKITGDALICLPESFDLHVHDGFGQYQVRRVRRVWLRGGAAGLVFVDAAI